MFLSVYKFIKEPKVNMAKEKEVKLTMIFHNMDKTIIYTITCTNPYPRKLLFVIYITDFSMIRNPKP